MISVKSVPIHIGAVSLHVGAVSLHVGAVSLHVGALAYAHDLPSPSSRMKIVSDQSIESLYQSELKMKP